MSLADRFDGRSRPVIHLFLGVEAIECAAALVHGRPARWVEGSHRRVAVERALGWPMAMQSLAAQQAPAGAAGLHVVVADSWLSVGSVPWSAALKRQRSAETNARLHLNLDGFVVEPADTVRIDDGAFGEPQLMVAYGAQMMSALAHLATSWNAPLQSVAPLSTVAWASSRAAAAPIAESVAVVGDGFAMLLRSLGARRHGRLSAVQVRVGLADTTVGLRTAHDLWRRSCLRDGRDAAQLAVPLIDMTSVAPVTAAQLSPPFALSDPSTGQRDSTAPSAALRFIAEAGDPRRVDAIRVATRGTPLRWAAVVAGIALVTWLGLHAGQAYRERDRLVAQLGAAAGARPTVVPLRQAFSREEVAKAQAVNAAVRELNLPIAALLDALQPPRDIRVAVLSVETSERAPAEAVSQSGVRIVAEARSSADMARYAAYVSDSKPFVAAYVVRHEIDDAAPAHPYRFTLEAMWSDR